MKTLKCPECEQPVLPESTVELRRGDVWHADCWAAYCTQRDLDPRTGRPAESRADKDGGGMNPCKGCGEGVDTGKASSLWRSGAIWHIGCFEQTTAVKVVRCEICEEAPATTQHDGIPLCQDCYENRPLDIAVAMAVRDPERNETELERVTRERDEWRDKYLSERTKRMAALKRGYIARANMETAHRERQHRLMAEAFGVAFEE